MPVAAHAAMLDSIAILGLRHGDLVLPAWHGGIAADPRIFDPLRRALRDGPLTIAHARQLGLLANRPVEDAAGAIAMLIAAGYAHPVASAAPEVSGAAALNQALAASIRDGEEPAYLVSPVLGTAIAADLAEILAVEALMEGRTGDEPSQAVRHGLTKGDHAMARDGASSEIAANAMLSFDDALTPMQEDRILLFRSIGILPA